MPRVTILAALERHPVHLGQFRFYVLGPLFAEVGLNHNVEGKLVGGILEEGLSLRAPLRDVLKAKRASVCPPWWATCRFRSSPGEQRNCGRQRLQHPQRCWPQR